MNDRVSWAQNASRECCGSRLRAGLWVRGLLAVCAGSAKGPAPGAPFFERASSPSRQPLRVSKHRRDTGRRVTDPNFFSAGHPASVCGDFWLSASRASTRSRTGGAPLHERLHPLRCPGKGSACAAPVPRGKAPRTGRIARRTGHSAACASCGSPHRRLRKPPETRVRFKDPRRRRRSPPASPGTETGRRP
jgi:hypothetical protein